MSPDASSILSYLPRTVCVTTHTWKCTYKLYMQIPFQYINAFTIFNAIFNTGVNIQCNIHCNMNAHICRPERLRKVREWDIERFDTQRIRIVSTCSA